MTIDVGRRQLISALSMAMVALPLAARGQQAAMPRIGVLMQPIRRTSFEQGLHDAGYIAGSNIALQYRPIDNADRLAAFVAELISLKVDLIVTQGSQATLAAQQATRAIPIVMAGASDPVGTGLVASLARPGGNITGYSLLDPEVSGKRLELLKDLVPGLTHVAVLVVPDDPPAMLSLKETEAAAATLGISLEVADVRHLGDFAAAFSSLVTHHPQALVILPAPLISGNMTPIAGWAVKSGLPSIFPFRVFPEAGGLMSYGANFDDLVRRSAVYVDKILKGSKPADLPVEQPTTFELVINLKTANTLGLTIPPAMLALADKVIEQ